MKRLLITLGALLAATVLWAPQALAQAVAPGTPPPLDPPRRVVLVMAPYLTWEDVTATSTPELWKLAGQGAVGDINARSRDREPGEPSSPLEGALTISAGAWAIPSYSAAAAFNVDERFEVGTAAEAFRRTTGAQVGTSRIVFLGMPVNVRRNAAMSFRAELGTLGQAVEDAGGVTAAIGNSDVGYVTGEQRKVRPAALAAMNSVGLVALGDVSSRVLREDPGAPFGIETDTEAFARVLDDVSAETKDAEGPALIVLDAGDAYRATKFETQVTPEIAATHRLRALGTLDRVVTIARQRFPDDVLIVASQSTGDALAGRMEGFGPIIVSAPGWNGYLSSSSTQREGIVTNLDLTATILHLLGLQRPVQVLGNEMTVASAPAAAATRIEELTRKNRTAIAVDSARAGVVNTFVVLAVVALLFSSVVLVRSKYWAERVTRRWVLVLKMVLLLALSVPVSSWLMFVWMPWPGTTAEGVLALLLTVFAVWAALVALMRFTPPRVPVAVGSLLTAVVLLADQFLGSPASFTNYFGYSPLLAWRFYGMGNEAAAILFGASVVGLALVYDEWPEAGWAKWAKRIGLPLFGAIAVFTAAAPFLGANVGVAVWGTVGFVLATVLMNGRHVTIKTILWMMLAVVLVIGAFALVDLYGGGEQTHLARALDSAETGGLAELWKIVARKAETNMRVLTHTRWTWILIAVVAFLALMRWRPQGDFADTLAVNPDFADAITVSLVAGLAAYFTEDSGIVIPALEVFYVGVALAWLMLLRVPQSSQMPAEPDAPEAGCG